MTTTQAAKHTPGPWKLRNCSVEHTGMTARCSAVVSTLSESIPLAFVVDEDGCAEANARLIAQAPAMAEALKRLRKSVVSMVWEPMGSTGDESDWFQCQLCGARTRGSGGHKTDCPMSEAERVLRDAGVEL